MALDKFCLHIISVLLAYVLISCGTVSAENINITKAELLTDSSIPGQQTDVSSIVYDGLLYVFWASNSVETPIGGDFDITYSTFDGNEWSQNVILTVNDTGNDHTPQPILYGDALYLFWSSNNAAITGGTNADIVFSKYDGISWSAPLSLTSSFGSRGDYNPWPVVYKSNIYIFFDWFSPQSNHYEIGYQTLAPDWVLPISTYQITNSSTGHNLNPTAAVVGQSLVVAWQSSSQDLAGTARTAIISKTLTDGQWSGFTSVSGTAGPMNIDPFMINYLGNGWLFWSTNSTELASGSDFDIVTRWHGSDGWNSAVTEISALQDSGDDMVATARVHDGRLIISWASSSPEYSEETDTDIIAVTYDETEWSQIIDISGPDSGREDGGGFTSKTPTLTSYDGKLIVVWETNASPLLTESTNTWLIFSECDFSERGFNYYWLAVPLIILAVAVVYLLARKKS